MLTKFPQSFSLATALLVGSEALALCGPLAPHATAIRFFHTPWSTNKVASDRDLEHPLLPTGPSGTAEEKQITPSVVVHGLRDHEFPPGTKVKKVTQVIRAEHEDWRERGWKVEIYGPQHGPEKPLRWYEKLEEGKEYYAFAKETRPFFGRFRKNGEAFLRKDINEIKRRTRCTDEDAYLAREATRSVDEACKSPWTAKRTD